MSTGSSTSTHNLPEFPYSTASEGRRGLNPLLSRSQFITTVVSPHPSPSASQKGAADQEDNAGPPNSSSAEITAHHSPAPACTDNSILTETLSFNHRFPPHRASFSAGSQPLRFKTSKPSQALGAKQSPVPIATGQECITHPSPRRRSAWHRFKRMGNHFVTPLRSMGLGFTACIGGRRAVDFCEDFSAHETSPGSSWYSSGEYPPEFIRAVLENNAYLGKVTLEC